MTAKGGYVPDRWLTAWLCAALATLMSCAPTYGGPVIDMHTHVTFGDESVGTAASADLPTLLAALKDGSVDHAGIITVARRGDIARTRRHNDALLSLARKHRQLFAIVSVHPLDNKAALDELRRAAAAGASGLKLHPNSQRLDVDAAEVHTVVAEATKLGLPVLIDGYNPLDANQTGKLLMLAVKHPKARIIIAHMGGPRFADTMVFGLVRKFKWFPRNVWVDLSATAVAVANSPFAEQFVWVLRSIGTDRVLFGSDFPVDLPTSARAAVDSLGLTASELKQVYYDNARSLFAVQAPQ